MKRLLNAFVLALMSVTVHAESTLLAGGWPGMKNLQGVIVKSTDTGKTWREVWFSDKRYQTVNAIEYFAEIETYVAVGRMGVLVSRDGDSWVNAGFPSKNTKPLHGVAYGDGVIMAVGASSNIIVSTDKGATWTHAYYGINGNIAAADKNWAAQVFGVPRTAHYQYVKFHNGEFWVTGSYDRLLRLKIVAGKVTVVSDLRNTSHSRDRANWLTVNGETVVIHARNRHWRSDDGGKNFQKIRRLKRNADLETGVFTGTHYVAAGHFGDVWTSTDAKAWTKVNSGSRAPFYDMDIDAAGNIYAVSGTDSLVFSADNGRTWNARAGTLVDVEEGYSLNLRALEIVEQAK